MCQHRSCPSSAHHPTHRFRLRRFAFLSREESWDAPDPLPVNQRVNGHQTGKCRAYIRVEVSPHPVLQPKEQGMCGFLPRSQPPPPPLGRTFHGMMPVKTDNSSAPNATMFTMAFTFTLLIPLTPARDSDDIHCCCGQGVVPLYAFDSASDPTARHATESCPSGHRQTPHCHCAAGTMQLGPPSALT